MKSVIIAPLGIWTLIYPPVLEKWETLPALASYQGKKRGVSQGSLKFSTVNSHPLALSLSMKQDRTLLEKNINLLMEIESS